MVYQYGSQCESSLSLKASTDGNFTSAGSPFHPLVAQTANALCLVQLDACGLQIFTEWPLVKPKAFKANISCINIHSKMHQLVYMNHVTLSCTIKRDVSLKMLVS